MPKTYMAIDAWRRLDAYVIRYRCFQILPDNRYCVQSADFYHPPFPSIDREPLDKQFLELFFEEAPEVRTTTYATLEEAIRAHNSVFGTDSSPSS